MTVHRMQLTAQVKLMGRRVARQLYRTMLVELRQPIAKKDICNGLTEVTATVCDGIESPLQLSHQRIRDSKLDLKRK
jgi:hypothetical protein